MIQRKQSKPAKPTEGQDGRRFQAGGEVVPTRHLLPAQPALLSSPLAPARGQGRQPRPAPSEAASCSSSLAGSCSSRRDPLSAPQRRRREAISEGRNYTSQKASRCRGCPPTAAPRKDSAAAPQHAGSCSPLLRARVARGVSALCSV